MEEDEVPREGKGFAGFFPVDADAEEDMVKDGWGDPRGESAEESSFARGSEASLGSGVFGVTHQTGLVQ